MTGKIQITGYFFMGSKMVKRCQLKAKNRKVVDFDFSHIFIAPNSTLWSIFYPSKGEPVDIYFVNLISNTQDLFCFYASPQRVYSQWQIVTFLPSTLICVSSYVSSNYFGQSRQSRIGCICLTFLHCAFSNVHSKHLHKMMHSRTGCICLTFLRCAFSNVSSNYLPEKRHSHTDYICFAFLHAVCYLMFSQIDCPRRCQVT